MRASLSRFFRNFSRFGIIDDLEFSPFERRELEFFCCFKRLLHAGVDALRAIYAFAEVDLALELFIAYFPYLYSARRAVAHAQFAAYAFFRVEDDLASEFIWHRAFAG